MASSQASTEAAQTEESFWERQNSISSNHDHPQMQSTPTRPAHPNFELFIATPAGKPLFHFAYDETHAQHPNHSPTAQPRPEASIASLSATLTAFQAKTHNNVSTIRSGSTSLLFHIHETFNAALLSRQKPAPLQFQQSILRVAIAVIEAKMSASLCDYLVEKPNARPILTEAEPLLKAALLDAVTHPLPYALLKPAALPSSSHPSTRLHLAQLLRHLLRQHTNLKHAVILTAGPPFPVHVVASCSPANNQLSSLDILLLCAHPNVGKDDGSPYYPHSNAFQSKMFIFSRMVHLRLHPDHHDVFKRAVGGHEWRPEWTRMAPHTLRVIALGDGDATPFFNAVEYALDRSAATTHILVCIERPFRIEQFGVRGARAVLCLHDKRRLAGTTDAFSYEVAISVLETLRQTPEGRRKSYGTAQLDHRAYVQGFPQWGLRVVVWDKRFVVCFDSGVQNDEAICVTRDVFAPWLVRYAASIVPEGERVCIHPPTPLAGLMAPFDS